MMEHCCPLLEWMVIQLLLDEAKVMSQDSYTFGQRMGLECRRWKVQVNASTGHVGILREMSSLLEPMMHLLGCGILKRVHACK